MAYATNSAGTSLSTPELDFYTLAGTPTAPVVSGATTNSLNVAIGTGDNNPAWTTYAIYETTQGKFVQSTDGSLSSTADYEAAATWGTTTVTGLAHGHYYVFEAQAKNLAGVATAYGPATSAGTTPVSFTPGNLVVERLGNGTESLSSDGNTMFMDEFTTNGLVAQSIQIPNSGPTALIDDGTATTGGGMTRSPDGQLLSFPGYVTAAPYSSSISGATSAAVPRGVGTVNSAGVYQLQVTTTTYYSATTIRSAATDDNGNFWTSGGSAAAGGGICYLGTNSLAADVTNGTYRQVFLFGTNLWFDVQNSSYNNNLGVYEFTGAPTTAATPGQVLTLPGSSTYGLSVDNPNNPMVIYYADATTGINKWTNNGSGVWTQAYVLYASDVFGLTVDWTTTPATIYATTTGAGNKLVSVVDNGPGSPATTLATAAANEIYRGVAFAPQIQPTQFQAASDFGPGFFGGENLGFTNVSGVDFYVWSSPDLSVAVTNWTPAGQTTEEVLGASGTSRYVFNVAPTTSPTYYIFAQTNAGPYTATEALTWVATPDLVTYFVTNSVAAIGANGIFALPAPPTNQPPVITQPPVSQTVLAGQNAGFTVTATGSGLNYQWSFNSTGIAGATTQVLDLTNVSSANAGPYAVVVTNWSGSVTSLVTLAVAVPPALTLGSPTPGTIQLNASSISNLTYIVQSTTNLANPVWANVLTNTTGINGGLNFQTNTAGTPVQFYRLVFP